MNLQVEQWLETSLFSLVLFVVILPNSDLEIKFYFFEYLLFALIVVQFY